MKTIFVSLLVIFTLFLFKENFAQNNRDGVTPKPISASILAKGTVLSPISVTSTRDLDFGNDILPGINKVIDKGSNSAGNFSIMGEAGKEVSIVISAPGTLTSGANNLPIVFSQTDGGYKITGGPIVDFDPANPVNANFGSDGLLDIYLGGSVIPAYTQAPGDYEGTVNVEFYYTGN